METIRCPDCGADLPVPAGATEGSIITCPNWAGLFLRLRKEGDSWRATIAHWVTCPECETRIFVPEGAQAGDRIECCGRHYRLTFEFGTFAAEPIEG